MPHKGGMKGYGGTASQYAKATKKEKKKKK